MTMDERVEAAARVLHGNYRARYPSTPRWDDLPDSMKSDFRLDGLCAIRLAFPELHGDQPKGWIAPWGSAEMLHEPLASFLRVYKAHSEHHGDYESAMRGYAAMRDAYLGKGGGG